MCLCSELQSTSLELLPDNANFVHRLEELLSLVHGLVSQNVQLTAQLSFTVKKRVAPSSEKESTRRTAKIFKYNPNEYNTRTLLKNNIQRWNENPSSFWIQFQGQQYYRSRDPQRLIVFACLQLGKSDAHSCILRRFYCVVLNRLRATSCACDDATTIADSMYDALHHGEPKLRSRKDLDDLIDAVESQIQAGSRYENIASRLGIGSLFLLGQDISRSVWEKWLPKSGDLFERAMCHLTVNGAVELGKFYEKPAEKIISYMINDLPRPAWIAESATPVQPSRKRRSASGISKAKRQRKGSKSARGDNQSYTDGFHRPQHNGQDVYTPPAESITGETHENVPEIIRIQGSVSSLFASSTRTQGPRTTTPPHHHRVNNENGLTHSIDGYDHISLGYANEIMAEPSSQTQDYVQTIQGSGQATHEQNPLVTTSNANYPLPGIPDYELSNPLDFASFAEPYILDFALYAAPFSIDFASFAAPSTFGSLNFPPSIPSALSDHEVENSAGLGPSK